MSTNAMEKALWQISVNVADAQRFAADAQAFLSDFRLTPDERRLILDMDVAEMGARGINCMVLQFAYQALHGRQAVSDYLQKLRAARGE